MTNVWISVSVTAVASGGIGALVSWFIAPAAARKQAEAMVKAAEQSAKATVESARETARATIEVEATKFRLRMAERHISKLHMIADEFEAVLREVPRKDQAIGEFMTRYPDVASLCLAAGRAIMRQHEDIARPAANLLLESAQKLKGVLEAERASVACRSDHNRKFMAAYSSRMWWVLSALMEVVDRSNEARAYPEPPGSYAEVIGKMVQDVQSQVNEQERGLTTNTD